MENIISSDNEFKNVSYGRMCCLLFKCVQEQMERIDKLENEVAELKGRGKPKTTAKPKVEQENIS